MWIFPRYFIPKYSADSENGSQKFSSKSPPELLVAAIPFPRSFRPQSFSTVNKSVIRSKNTFEIAELYIILNIEFTKENEHIVFDDYISVDRFIYFCSNGLEPTISSRLSGT